MFGLVFRLAWRHLRLPIHRADFKTRFAMWRATCGHGIGEGLGDVVKTCSEQGWVIRMMSPEQNKHMTCMENGNHNFPLSSKEKRSCLHFKIDNNKSMNSNNDQNAPNYKQIKRTVQ